MRKSSSIRLGLLLAVSALLVSCEGEKPPERRCVDSDGRFVDEGLCSAADAPGPDGGIASNATGSWDAPDGGPERSRGGFHFIWVPYGMFGGMGTYAPGYVRGGPAFGGNQGPASSGTVSRGGFGATGAAHAGSTSASGT